MRIYFRGQLRYMGCYYYRCMLPLQANGWEGDLITLRSSLPKSEEATKSIMQSNIIVFQRPFEKANQELFIACKQAGKMCVVDNDDTYKVDDTMKLGEMLTAVSDGFEWFVKSADLVTASTDFLANEYRKLNPNVLVLPNMINPTDFPPRQHNRGKKVRIGIIGSVGHTKDVEHVKGLIKELSEREDVTLVLFSLSNKEADPFWKDIKCEWQPFVEMKDYFKVLAKLKLDMVLIPRQNNYFNRCKSNVKFLEMSVLGIPCVAQTWNDGESPYDKDGEYMVLANTEEQWRKSVNDLVADKEARKMIGSRAKKYVLANYDIRKTKDLWSIAYKKLIQ